jgi:hypothetical protein
MKFPADMRIQQIANLSVVFSFMKAHVKLVSIGPQGNEPACFSLPRSALR